MSKANKHSAILIAAFVANALLNYAFSVMMSWFLSPAEFGKLGIAQSLLLLTGLAVGSGFAWTAAHDIALSGICDETRRRFRTEWVANTTLGVFLAGGLWLAFSSRLLPLGPDYLLIILFVGLTTVLLAMRSVLNGAVRGLYWFGALGANLVAEVVIKAGVGYALVANGKGVPGVLTGFACGAFVTFLHSLWLLKSAHLWSWKGRLERKVIWMTIPLFLGMIGPSLILNLDILGLKLLAPASESDKMAGLYQAAVILARTPVFFAQSIGMVFFSYVAGTNRAGTNRAGIDQAGGEGETFHYLRTAARAWMRLLLPIALGLIIAPQTALTIFYPAPYHQLNTPLRLAAAGGALLALAVLFTGILQATGNRFWPALVTGIAVIAQIVILVQATPDWGITGAAASLFGGGLVASTGLILPVYSLSRPSFPKPTLFVLRRLAWTGLPFVFLAIPLLILPGGGRGTEMLKILIAGTGYCLALLATHPVQPGFSDRPVRRQIAQLVNVLLGG